MAADEAPRPYAVRVGVGLLHLLGIACSLLPVAWQGGIARGMGQMLVWCGPRRAVIRKQMLTAYPELADDANGLFRLVSDNYCHYASLLIECLCVRRLRRVPDLRRVVIDGLAHCRCGLMSGSVVATAHQGNFLYMAAASGARGIPLTIVSKRFGSAVLEAFYHDVMAQFGVRLEFNRGSMRALLRDLREGAALGFMLDIHDSRGDVVIDFMGRPATCLRVLPALASRGVPVFHATARRGSGGRHQCTVRPVMLIDRHSDDDVQAEWAQCVTNEIVGSIRACPSQWFWIHRRWKKTPVSAVWSREARISEKST